jgi:DNA-binding response OmpR family regulator
MRILLIDDDQKFTRLLVKGLEEENFVVDVAHTGGSGAEMGRGSHYEIIVLDWLLPDRDGLAVCQDLRARRISTPILMLTARDALEDRVAGLNAGAGDYLTKPFEFSELLARIHALLRRPQRADQLARLDALESRERSGQNVPLATILEEAMSHLALEASQRDVTVALDAPGDAVVRANPAAASLVVAHILGSAVKVSPPGGRVRVGVSTDAVDAVVAVSDSGPGIPESEIPRLFEHFYRGSAARASDVPGVGLAICRLLAEGQGGSIAVSNSPGGGATFHIRLPLAV